MTLRALYSLLLVVAFGVACASNPVEKPERPDPEHLSRVTPEEVLVTRPSEPLTLPPEETEPEPEATGSDGFGDRGYVAGLAQEWEASNKSASVFMRLAVKRGLYLDGVGARLAMDVANERGGPLWVTKCPICRPVEAAFREHAGYVQAKDLGADLAGARPHPLTKALDADQEVRHKALGHAVNGWVKDAIRAFRIGDADQKRLKSELAGDRKQGMSLKPDAFMYCPSCDGALGEETIL